MNGQAGDDWTPQLADAFPTRVDGFFHATKGLAQRLDLLRQLIEFSDLLLLLAGPAGAGKSALLAELLRNPGARWRVCEVVAPAGADGAALLDLILAGYGLDPGRESDPDERIRLLERHLETQQRHGLVSLIVIDDADRLDEGALQLVRRISARFEGVRPRLLLAGTSEVLAPLVAAGNDGAAYTHLMELPPLDEAETLGYVQARLQKAALDVQAVPRAYLHDALSGRPRLPGVINAALREHAASLRPRAAKLRRPVNEGAATRRRPGWVTLAMVLAGALGLTLLLYPVPEEAPLEPQAPEPVAVLPGAVDTTSPDPPAPAAPPPAPEVPANDSPATDNGSGMPAAASTDAPPGVTRPDEGADTDGGESTPPLAMATDTTPAETETHDSPAPTPVVDDPGDANGEEDRQAPSSPPLPALSPGMQPDGGANAGAAPADVASAAPAAGTGEPIDDGVAADGAPDAAAAAGSAVPAASDADAAPPAQAAPPAADDESSLAAEQPASPDVTTPPEGAPPATSATDPEPTDTPVPASVAADDAEPAPPQPATPRGGTLEWLQAQPPDRYTVQLTGSSERAAAEGFVRLHGLAGEAVVVRTVRDGADWFIVVQGSHASPAAARAAIERLPQAQRRDGPWLRPIADVLARAAR